MKYMEVSISAGAGAEYFIASNLSVSTELGLGGNNNRFGLLAI
jgi:hypothetical protein